MLGGQKRLEDLAAVERRKRQQIKDRERDVHRQHVREAKVTTGSCNDFGNLRQSPPVMNNDL